MNADEARQYAKELQHENKEERVLGPFNKWFIRWCIRKINKEIRRAIKRGSDCYLVVFIVTSLFPLKDLDKLFLAGYYKSQGYHVELRSGSMNISWAEEWPWWFRDEKSWHYLENDTTPEGN